MLRTRKPTSVKSSEGGDSPLSTFSVELQEEKKLGYFDDVQIQEVRLYIEGVQVPFDNVNISQPYLAKPTATLTIPPAAGLSEIARNYFPKVHIFYRDVEHERYLLQRQIPYEDEDIFKVLFSGVIHRSSYNKYNGAQGAQASIQFQCIHKDYITDEILIKYGGRGTEVFRQGSNLEQEVAGQSSYVSSQMAALKALQGIKAPGSPEAKDKIDIDTFIRGYIDGEYTEEDINVVDPNILSGDLFEEGKFDHVQGIPAIMIVLWQIIKMDAYRFNKNFTEAMRRMYIPLLDEGLRYFSRMKGHSVIEEEIQIDKASIKDALSHKDGTAGATDSNYPEDIMIPPSFRTFLGKAVATDMAIKVVQNIVIGSQETLTLENIFLQIINTLRYDRIYLSSPVQSVAEGSESTDKVVKPLLPFYYSPVCNVFLPNMYESIQVTDGYYDTPTRVKSVNQGPIIGSAESFGNLEYRAPHDVRRAASLAAARGDSRTSPKPDLSASLVHKGEILATHELGQGIRAKQLPTPTWINHLNMSHQDQETKDPSLSTGTMSNADEIGLQDLIDGWKRKYPNDPQSLNPWEMRDINGLMGYQRNIINSLEYDYSLSIVETRAGRLQGVFNPYVVPGYPCDIVDPSPDRPSFHAFVVDVTHSISNSGNIGTSVSFSSVLTYEEMQSYDMPPVFPWLRVQLGLDQKSNLLNQSEETKAIASDYYKDVLGVGFADPTYLYDFDVGSAKKAILNTHYGDFAVREKGSKEGVEASDGAIYDTVEGNLTMVRREIESMSDLVTLEDRTFIHLGDRDGDPSTAISVSNSNLTDEEREDVEVFLSKATDVGRSTFLDYEE